MRSTCRWARSHGAAGSLPSRPARLRPRRTSSTVLLSLATRRWRSSPAAMSTRSSSRVLWGDSGRDEAKVLGGLRALAEFGAQDRALGRTRLAMTIAARLGERRPHRAAAVGAHVAGDETFFLLSADESRKGALAEVHARGEIGHPPRALRFVRGELLQRLELTGRQAVCGAQFAIEPAGEVVVALHEQMPLGSQRIVGARLVRRRLM